MLYPLGNRIRPAESSGIGSGAHNIAPTNSMIAYCMVLSNMRPIALILSSGQTRLATQKFLDPKHSLSFQ
jgi:hypothetical protein